MIIVTVTSVEELRFQIVFYLSEDEKPPLLGSYGLKSVFRTFFVTDKCGPAVGLAIEIKQLLLG